jgi:hypothetical protein
MNKYNLELILWSMLTHIHDQYLSTFRYFDGRCMINNMASIDNKTKVGARVVKVALKWQGR